MSFFTALCSMYNTHKIVTILKSGKPELGNAILFQNWAYWATMPVIDYNENSDIDILVDFNAGIDGFG